MIGSVLDAGDIAVNKTNKNFAESSYLSYSKLAVNKNVAMDFKGKMKQI